MPSHKISRISSDILRHVNHILLTDAEDVLLKLVTITDCKVTSDLSYANIYFNILGDEITKEEMLIKLDEASSFIRSELAKLVDLRHTPKLRFIYDDSIANGMEIEKIIKKVNDK